MKDLKISDELLCEILGCDVAKAEIKDNTLEYDCDFINVVMSRNINIYEFAYKCKEWAFKKGFNMFSSCKSFSIFQDGVLICSVIGENNEIEAIIKACNWILEQNK